MKKILFVILCVGFLPLFCHIYAQKPHYYYFDKVIELTENPMVRYIDLVDDVSNEQEASLRGKLREYATEAQYGTNKYIYTIYKSYVDGFCVEDYRGVSKHHIVKFRTI